MSLSDRLASLDEKRVRKNTVDVWLDSLPAEDKNLVLKYMHDDNVSTLSLMAALKDEGAPFGKDSLRDYRRGLRNVKSK